MLITCKPDEGNVNAYEDNDLLTKNTCNSIGLGSNWSKRQKCKKPREIMKLLKSTIKRKTFYTNILDHLLQLLRFRLPESSQSNFSESLSFWPSAIAFNTSVPPGFVRFKTITKNMNEMFEFVKRNHKNNCKLDSVMVLFDIIVFLPILL